MKLKFICFRMVHLVLISPPVYLEQMPERIHFCDDHPVKWIMQIGDVTPLSCYLLAFVMLKYLECSVAFVVNAILSFCRFLKTRTSFLPEFLLEIVFKNFIWCYISDCFSRMFCQFHVLVFSSLMKSCYKVEMVRPKFFLSKLFIDILCNCFYNDY